MRETGDGVDVHLDSISGIWTRRARLDASAYPDFTIRIRVDPKSLKRVREYAQLPMLLEVVAVDPDFVFRPVEPKEVEARFKIKLVDAELQ